MPTTTPIESFNPSQPPFESESSAELMPTTLEQKLGKQTIDTQALDAELTTERIRAIAHNAEKILDIYHGLSTGKRAKHGQHRLAYYDEFIAPLTEIIDAFRDAKKTYDDLRQELQASTLELNKKFLDHLDSAVRAILLQEAMQNYCLSNDIPFASPDREQRSMGATSIVNGYLLQIADGYGKNTSTPQVRMCQLSSSNINLQDLCVDPQTFAAHHLNGIRHYTIPKQEVTNVPRITQPKAPSAEASPAKASSATNIPVIASKPNHQVGLKENHNEPPYAYPQDMKNTAPEALLSMIIDDALGDRVIDGYKLTRTGAGQRIRNSVRPKNDPVYIQILKRLAANQCGVSLNMRQSAIIGALDGKIRASGLRDFLAYAYEWSHPDTSDSQQHIDAVMDGLSGFRIEASVIKMARLAGHDVREATADEDDRGADLFIDDIPFDCKSSQRGVNKGVRKFDSQKDRVHSILLVPPITVEDFAGELVISDETAKRLVETTDFCTMIDNAVAEYLGMPVEREKAS